MEQQNQQPIQEETENKPSLKTNWKFISIFILLSILIGGVAGYYFLTQKPEEQKVEKIVYTKAAWDGDVGRVRRLIVANRDGTGRKILLEKMPNEHPGISAAILLIPKRNEVVVVTQGRFYPYDIDVEKIDTETGQRSKLAMYKEGGIHGMSLLSVILSPDKKKIALTIRKHLFIVDITKGKLVALKPSYTDTQLRDGESIAPAFWDSLGNIYLKSFEGKTEENRINDFIKVNSQGKREELSIEQKTFFKVPSSESQVVDFRLYPSPDGKFAAWGYTSSKEGTLSQKILVYSVEERWWFIRLKKDSIQMLENEKAINFQKERLDSPLHNVEIKGWDKESIAGAQLYIDGVLVDSIAEISVVGYGQGKAFETLGFVSGIPISGWERDWQEKARDRQEAEFQAFKKISLYPEYLPSGWVKENERGDRFGIVLDFRNEKNGLLFIQEQKQDAQIPQGFIAIRDYISQYPKYLITTQESILIGTSRGLYFTVSSSKQILTWSAEGLDIAISCFDSEGCSLDKEELIKIAHSMKPITTLQQGSRQTGSTAGWQTYRNDESGFEVKYPRELSLRGDVHNGIEISDLSSKGVLRLIQQDKTERGALNALGITFCADYPKQCPKERIKIGDISVEITWQPNTATTRVDLSERYALNILLESGFNKLQEKEKDFFRKFLSTFRFMPTPKPVSTRVAKEITVTAKKNQWRFVPEEFEVNQEDKVVLTVVNEDDYDHGFAIDQFGISERIPANNIIKVEFMATQAGDFPFYSSVPSGGGVVNGEKRTYYDMVGKIHVRSLIPETK